MDNTVDTSMLTNVLGVDRKQRLAYVESNVPMDKLVDETMKHGFIPPVVMEFPGITVGGGFQGTSGESSSFRHGFFDRTVKGVEVVLADGQVVVASEDAYTDLFRGAASSFGTLGVATLLVLELIEAKQYVSLTYIKVQSMTEAVDLVREQENNPKVDYIDGLLFAKDHGVVCLGHLSDDIAPNTQVQSFNAPWDRWFYLNAKKLSTHRDQWTETVPIVDYLFRYYRGAFQVAVYAFQYFLNPFNCITHRVLDYFMRTRVMYHVLHKSGHAERYIIQDVATPYAKTVEFLDYLDEEFRHYPLWLCPLRVRGKSPESTHRLLAEDLIVPSQTSEPKMMMNFGVCGP